MADFTFTIEGDVNVQVTVTEVAGDLVFNVEVLDDTGSIGDLRGLFFNIGEDSLLPGLSITGDDVTNTGMNTKNLGNGNNMNGGGRKAFDLGASFGEPGLKGGEDDIRETEFTLSHNSEDLSIDLVIGELFGARLTSVGEEGGSREGSLKLTDTPECDPVEVCTDIVVDFEEFVAGDVVDTLIFGDLTVTVSGAEDGEVSGDNDAMVFDTANPTGGDDDLATNFQGNVLIISEDDDASDPDDSADGGDLVFEFNESVSFTSIVVIDANGGGTISDEDGNVVILPNQEDGGIDTIDLSAFTDVSTLTVSLTGSGAVDDLMFTFCETVNTCDEIDFI